MTKVCVEFDQGDGAPEPEARSYTTAVGDGTQTSYTVTHGLGTRDPFYVLRDTASGVLDGSEASVTVLDENRVRLDFTTAPASGAASVTLLKA